MTLRARCEAILALIDEMVGAAEPPGLRVPAVVPARVDERRPIVRPVDQDRAR